MQCYERDIGENKALNHKVNTHEDRKKILESMWKAYI